MKTMILCVAALLGGLSTGAFAATPDSQSGDATASATACQKGCMAHHDGSVVACKTVKNSDPSTVNKCVRSADLKQRSCDKECVAKHPVKTKPQTQK